LKFLEVLVRDVAYESADESQDGKRLEGGLSPFGVVLEGEADGVAVVVRDPVLGQHRPFGVAADVAQRGRGIKEAGPDVGVPGELPELAEEAAEEADLIKRGGLAGLDVAG